MTAHVTIAEARALGQRHGFTGVVVFSILTDGRIAITSWGRTRRLCAALGRWIESEAADDVMASISDALEAAAEKRDRRE